MDSLQEYEGTLVFVSHDRYFLDGLASKVIEVGNRRVEQYLGNYEDYLRKKEEMERVHQVSQAEESAAPTHSMAASMAAPEARKKKVNPYKIQQMKLQIEQVEGKIHVHETRIAALNHMLAAEELYRDHQLFRTTMEDHDKLQQDLNEFMTQWESLHSELDGMQN